MNSGAPPAAAARHATLETSAATVLGPVRPELRLSRGLLVALALLLAFEAPLFRLGPLQITTVELVLYAALAAWGVAVMLDIWRGGLSKAWAGGAAAWRTDPAVQAAVLWCAVLFVSAARAPSYRAAALKFALRSLSGVLVFFAARSLARPPDVARRVMLALVLGGALSAATALIEWGVPGSEVAFRPFREEAFGTLGLVRASGVFGYPTIGAMYWEAVAPLAIVIPLVATHARSARTIARGAGLAMLASALLIGAILLSGTRSSLAGAAVASGALLWLGWSVGPWMRGLAAWVLGLVALSVIALRVQGSASPLAERLRWWHDDQWLRAEYSVEAAPRVVRAGELFAVPVTVRNTGTVDWPHGGGHPTHLAYHWERKEGAAQGATDSALAVFEGRRTALPADVPPGAALDVVALVEGPPQVGSYKLRWDLVQEGVAWFSDHGNPMPEQDVDVRLDAEEGGPAFVDDQVRPAAEIPPPSRPALWRAAVALWWQSPLLGIGPDNFRRRYEAVVSPSPNGQPYTDTRTHANSLYFETLADLGIAGVAALGAIALVLVRLLRGHATAGRLAGLGCAAAAATFFVHGGLDYFFEFTPLFGLFWLLLGLTAACATQANRV